MAESSSQNYQGNLKTTSPREVASPSICSTMWMLKTVPAKERRPDVRPPRLGCYTTTLFEWRPAMMTTRNLRDDSSNRGGIRAQRGHYRERVRRPDRRNLCRASQPQAARASTATEPGGQLTLTTMVENVPRLSRRHSRPGTDRADAQAGASFREPSFCSGAVTAVDFSKRPSADYGRQGKSIPPKP